MSADTRRRGRMTKRIAGIAAVIILVTAMALDTTFLTPQAAAALNPPPFNAETFATEQFPKVSATIRQKAIDLPTLAGAVAQDPVAAGRQYGQDLGSGTYAFPVKATGTATEVDTNFVRLAVDGVPEGSSVRIPLGAAVSGTPIRDATGEIRFGDFTGQTEFQSVANQFKLRIQQDVIAKLDPKSLQGKKVTVYGAWATGGPPRSFLIQPVSIEAGS
jgi:predicted lipoprotein